MNQNASSISPVYRPINLSTIINQLKCKIVYIYSWTALKFYITNSFFKLVLGTGTHLFVKAMVKVPRQGDRDRTFSVFESSCHLLLPI